MKASCTFKGWFTDPEFKNQITELDSSIKKDMDIYAKWIEGVVESSYTFNFGLSKKYVIYQVSDTHINAGTSEDDLQKERNRLDSSRIAYANKYGEVYDKKYLCKESKQGLTNLINYINNEEADAVCYSGDLMDFYSEANYQFVEMEIKKTKAPFVYAMGNHETPVAKYSTMPGVDTLEFTVLDLGEFEIVCLDNSQGEYTNNQYNLLLAETNKNKPIVIVQHIPLLTDYNVESSLIDAGGYFYLDIDSTPINKKVGDLICNNENIKLVLCGHIHGKSNTEIAEGKTQIACSSGLMRNLNKITIR